MTVTSFGSWAWVLFGAIVLVMLVVDLRGARSATWGCGPRRCAAASGSSIGLGFGVAVFALAGPGAGFAYWAAYLVEKSLSVHAALWYLVLITGAVPWVAEPFGNGKHGAFHGRPGFCNFQPQHHLGP